MAGEIKTYIKSLKGKPAINGFYSRKYKRFFKSYDTFLGFTKNDIKRRLRTKYKKDVVYYKHPTKRWTHPKKGKRYTSRLLAGKEGMI